MLEKGITNCDVLIQGIDPDLFYPTESSTRGDRFVIFSGGKLELRKGQDLVLRAVQILQDKYPDIWLVNCWYNLWPAPLQMMKNSPHIRFAYSQDLSWHENMMRTYADNGLDPERVVTCELTPHEKLRELYAQTDLGVFPNRCEGGTNLVLMEYMACGKPVVASNTSGHQDILTPENALVMDRFSDLKVVSGNGEVMGRWQEPSLDELVSKIEFAYRNREMIKRFGQKAAEDLGRLTWRRSARRLLELLGIPAFNDGN
jgi:glycosyltransferase involved in cell wall biosynthesis